MHTVYLDNAATSFPKPPEVGARMREYVDEVGASVSRGSYETAQQAELVTLRLRQRLCALFGFADPSHVILTPGNTWGLNSCSSVRCGRAIMCWSPRWSTTRSCGR